MKFFSFFISCLVLQTVTSSFFCTRVNFSLEKSVRITPNLRVWKCAIKKPCREIGSAVVKQKSWAFSLSAAHHHRWKYISCMLARSCTMTQATAFRALTRLAIKSAFSNMGQQCLGGCSRSWGCPPPTAASKWWMSPLDALCHSKQRVLSQQRRFLLLCSVSHSPILYAARGYTTTVSWHLFKARA